MASSGSTRVMNERPAPRCKRRRYRCASSAQPIRTSTVKSARTRLCDKLIGIAAFVALDSRCGGSSRRAYRLSNGIYC